jgi:hypothetical protein
VTLNGRNIAVTRFDPGPKVGQLSMSAIAFSALEQQLLQTVIQSCCRAGKLSLSTYGVPHLPDAVYHDVRTVDNDEVAAILSNDLLAVV